MGLVQQLVQNMRTNNKCIYCGTQLIKGKRSKEHVLNRSIVPLSNNNITLTNKVCKECNENFDEIDKAFVKNTIVGLNKTVMDIINDEERWDSTQEPFVLKDFSMTIKGDKEVFTLETNAEQENNILRGIAKIGFNALIFDLKGKKVASFKDEQNNCHYTCARNDDIFSGHEEVFSDIKKYIKEGGKSPIQIQRKEIPLRVYDEKMNVEGNIIRLKDINNPLHIIVLHKIQSFYYALIGLFIGLIENPPLYFVPLIGDRNEININTHIIPEEVRLYNFRHLVKKQPKQKRVKSTIIDIPKDNSANLIVPVNDPELIFYINHYVKKGQL